MLRNPNWGTGAAGNSEFGHAEKSGQENVADRRIWFLIIGGLSATIGFPWYMLCRACMQKMHASSELESSDMQCRSGGLDVEGGVMRGAIARVASAVDISILAEKQLGSPLGLLFAETQGGLGGLPFLQKDLEIKKQ